MQSDCENKNEPILNIYNMIKIADSYWDILPRKLNFTFKDKCIHKS